MKVMAFNARPDERAFFDHFGQSLNMDLELQPGTLTVDNAGLTRGFDGISCTCDLPAPVLEKLAEKRCTLRRAAHHRLRQRRS